MTGTPASQRCPFSDTTVIARQFIVRLRFGNETTATAKQSGLPRALVGRPEYGRLEDSGEPGVGDGALDDAMAECPMIVGDDQARLR